MAAAEPPVLDESAAPPTPPGELTPVSEDERIETVDILRGFALFGVLACNMKGYSLPMQAYFGFGGDWPLSTLDQWVDRFLLLFLRFKAISMFAFLFGFGFSIQFLRAQAKGISIVPRYMRRLLILFLFGMAHVVFFWFGDILHTYALVGFLLILFRNRSLKFLEHALTWWWTAPAIVVTIIVLVMAYKGNLGGDTDGNQQVQAAMQHEVAIYQHGSYLDQMHLRMEQWGELYVGPAMIGLTLFTLGLFLMGLYAGKRGLFSDVEGNRVFLTKAMRFGLYLGGATSVAMVLPDVPRWHTYNFLVALLANGYGWVLFVFYAAGGALLLHDSRAWHDRLAFFGPVGRMALTNYLMQSVICTTIFDRFGMIGKMGSAWGLVLTIVLFAAQVLFSRWWLRRYRFGPMEWAWRSATYGKAQPMLITS